MQHWNVPAPARATERAVRALARVESRARHTWSLFDRDRVGLLGSYGTSNVGDRTFAVVLSRAAASLGTPAVALDYGRVSAREVGGRPLVVGGPANYSFYGFAGTLGELPSSVALAGVAGRYARGLIPDAAHTFLGRARYVGVRDSQAYAWLTEVLPGAPVVQHPDLAFALPAFCPVPPPNLDERVLAISVVPFMARFGQGRWRPVTEPSKAYKAAKPELAERSGELAQAYVQLIRRAVGVFCSRGWRVVHIPFALEDASFVAATMGDSGIEQRPYDPRPGAVLRAVAGCGGILATRFHAHVYGLAAGVPVFSAPYTDKCDLLMSDLGHTSVYLGPQHWLTAPEEALERLTSEPNALHLSPSEQAAATQKALAAARAAVEAVTAG